MSRAAGLLLGAFLLSACEREEVLVALRVVGGEPEAGRAVIAAVEWGVCHHIPGVRGANGVVGSPLSTFGRRQLIAGVMPNQPAVLVRWVKDAPSLAPNTGMPELPLTDEEVRHVAAYLYTLR